ncbi:C-GCAxxG-C-C family protein [Desnuesiella massiliensis]|uniref:C-GCAxxG-C-C family protein n=1 Tax=Desnuesiella massiliensis TaxID=1650662 RepID=UPI0006E16814|nr:C-GCAxxG-C-C family protein [Desnuesiella massiliensis]
MSEKVQKALELFNSGFNCSQAVMGTFCRQFGMDEQLSMKLTCGFAGGLRCGEVCGAVAGAVMIIGLRYGQYIADDKASKVKCYEITSQFMEECVKRKGTVLCREILGYDVRDTVTRAKFPGRQTEVCPKIIETVVLLLEEMGF